MHSRCTLTTDLENIFNVHLVDSQNTQSVYLRLLSLYTYSLYHQYTARIRSHCTSKTRLEQYTARMHSQCTPKYTGRIQCHCIPSRVLKYVVTTPPVHSWNTQSFYPQYTTRIRSHCTPIYIQNTHSLRSQHISIIRNHCTGCLKLECIFTMPLVHTWNTQSEYPPSTQLGYMVAASPVEGQNTQWQHLQFPARIHSHCSPSTQLEYVVTALPIHRQNAQSLQPQYTAGIRSHCTPNTQLEYIVPAPQYKVLTQSQYTSSTQVEYVVTTPQYTTRLHIRCIPTLI